jgi:hypothetical protein
MNWTSPVGWNLKTSLIALKLNFCAWHQCGADGGIYIHTGDSPVLGNPLHVSVTVVAYFGYLLLVKWNARVFFR